MSEPVPSQLPIVAVAGPTGIGKTRLALALARLLDGEIVNYDSVQVYRGFDIGSAKPSAAERAAVPHHLFDIVDAGDEFNASDYAGRAVRVTREIRERHHLPVFVGGTGFYLRAFLAGLPEMPGRNEALRARLRPVLDRPRGRARLHRMLTRLDPQSAARIAPADRHRLERALEVALTTGRPISSWSAPSAASPRRLDCLIIALAMPRPQLREILDRRVTAMFEAGLVDETRALLAQHPEASRPFTAIGYREAAQVVSASMGFDEAIEEARRRTRAYAKRQMTWLRSERNVHWIDATAGLDDQLRAARALLDCQTEHEGV